MANARNLAIIIMLLPGILFISCRGSQPNTGWVDRYNRGVTMLEQGEYKNAITEFEAALRADPGNFDIIKDLAGANALEGNWDRARSLYVEARTLRPEDPSIYVNLAQVYHNLGDSTLAWEMLRTAWEKDPGYPLAHYVAGELHLADGNVSEAVAAFSDYIAIETDTRYAFDAREILRSISETGTVPREEGIDLDAASLTDEELVEEEEIVEPEEVIEEEVTEEVTEPVVEEEAITEDEEPEEETEVEEDTEPEVEPAPLPVLEGDELYQDRLSRGRQMRAIGETEAAIQLLLEAYGVHPNYAQVNRELGLAYVADGQISEGLIYLRQYVSYESDPAARAEIEARIESLTSSEEETSEDDGASDEQGDEEETEENDTANDDFLFF